MRRHGNAKVRCLGSPLVSVWFTYSCCCQQRETHLGLHGHCQMFLSSWTRPDVLVFMDTARRSCLNGHFQMFLSSWTLPDVLVFMDTARCSCPILTTIRFTLKIVTEVPNFKFQGNMNMEDELIRGGRDEVNRRFYRERDRV